MDICINGKARCGQQAAKRDDVVAIQAERVGEFEPARDPAILVGATVMIDQPAPPFATQCRIWAACNQAGVLHRYHGLVVVAVERPGLDLSFAALTSVEQGVKRMVAVIPPGAEIA